MNSSMSKIQKISKAGLILSKIVLWCAYMGLISCALILIVQIFVGNSKIVGDSSIVLDMIKDKSKLNVGTIYTALTIGIIMCITKIIHARLEVKYFNAELQAGTPFKLELVEQLRKLGIQTIVIPLIGVILSNVAYEIFKHFYINIGEMDISNSVSIGLGIVYLVISLLCRAAIEEKE